MSGRTLKLTFTLPEDQRVTFTHIKPRDLIPGNILTSRLELQQFFPFSENFSDLPVE